ncbi:class I SAM-dependent methyltransferase [Micromonospora sp. CA-263727]|uniref:class I SAM-dependent methyltransferase n=1 Tax=Micromonospora sp. CA-263727 TaxID=3239967 RepID=UPI003D938A9C
MTSTPVHQLLDPTVRTHLDRLRADPREAGPDGRLTGIVPGQAVLQIGAGAGGTTDRLAEFVGDGGSVTVVDADVHHLAAAGVVRVQRCDVDREPLPGGTQSVDHIVARWHRPLRDPVDLVRQMIARLRPGGTLALVSITPTPPRVYRAPGAGDAQLIGTVMHQVRCAIAGPEGSWTSDVENLLLDSGAAWHCSHTVRETWTGGDPGCRLLADIVAHLRATLTGLSDSDLGRFQALMADPRVLVASYRNLFIHAGRPA